MIKIECDASDLQVFLDNQQSIAEDRSRLVTQNADAWRKIDTAQATIVGLREKLAQATRSYAALAASPRNQPSDNIEHVRSLLSALLDDAGDDPWSRKILAIKMVRSLTGYGLKESKDLVEEFAPFRPGAILIPSSTD